jgi:hypothetical protein
VYATNHRNTCAVGVSTWQRISMNHNVQTYEAGRWLALLGDRYRRKYISNTVPFVVKVQYCMYFVVLILSLFYHILDYMSNAVRVCIFLAFVSVILFRLH